MPSPTFESAPNSTLPPRCHSAPPLSAPEDYEPRSESEASTTSSESYRSDADTSPSHNDSSSELSKEAKTEALRVQAGKLQSAQPVAFWQLDLSRPAPLRPGVVVSSDKAEEGAEAAAEIAQPRPASY